MWGCAAPFLWQHKTTASLCECERAYMCGGVRHHFSGNTKPLRHCVNVRGRTCVGVCGTISLATQNHCVIV